MFIVFCFVYCFFFFFFKQKTAYEMRISDWSSDVCSSDLGLRTHRAESGGDESPASGSSSVEFRQRLHPESESAPRSVVQQKPIPIAGCTLKDRKSVV